MKTRNPKIKEKFLKKKGLSKTPSGMEIDHKKPLADGGKDSVENMQFLRKSEHKSKTVRENKKRNKK